MSRTRIAKMDAPRYASLALRSLQRFGTLTPIDEAEIRRRVADAEVHLPASELLCEGEPLDHARILLSGWAAKVRFLGDGRRQILSFVIPGDTFGLAARPCAVALCSTIALTTAVIAPISLVSDAIAGPDTSNGLGAIAWCMLRNEEACLLSQIMRVGRQSAYERVANLLLEIYHRLKSISFVQGNRYVLPLTQEMLADALGLSVVHTNRILQQLRRDRLIEWNSSAINILQPEVLEEIADFHKSNLALSAAAPNEHAAIATPTIV
jgi:CRP-like cAMP-binding protein